jgi:hypothetical protein
MYLELKPIPGDNIDECILLAIKIATNLGILVRFNFNGIPVNVIEGSNPIKTRLIYDETERVKIVTNKIRHRKLG